MHLFGKKVVAPFPAGLSRERQFEMQPMHKAKKI
jgi:hypothetical protein